MARTGNKTRPATSLEERQQILVGKAIDEAERLIDSGRASSQVLTHFLKLGTTTHQLEIEKLRHETALIEAKSKSLESSTNVEKLIGEAMDAMKLYTGNGDRYDE